MFEVISTSGCCKECLDGQQGRLNRPYGQGHQSCYSVPEKMRDAIDRGLAFQSFHLGSWRVILNSTIAAENWWRNYRRGKKI